jgi:DNA repair ATPase RecN
MKKTRRQGRAKTEKNQQPTNSSTLAKESAEDQILRLEAANLQLRMMNLLQQRNALDTQARQLSDEYMAKYEALKKMRKVPEGKEINLETGEIFDARPVPVPKEASS